MMPVRSHHRTARGSAGASSTGVNTHQRGRAIDDVAEKNVAGIVRVVGDKIASAAFKKRKLAICGDSSRKRIAIAAPGSGLIDADQVYGAGNRVTQIYIGPSGQHIVIVVRQCQVVGCAREQDISTVLTDDGKPGIPAAAKPGSKRRPGDSNELCAESRFIERQKENTGEKAQYRICC